MPGTLCAIARWNNPAARGIASSAATDPPPADSPATMGSLIICTAGRTDGAADAPGHEDGTARCPMWAPLPKPAATCPPAAPIAPLIGGVGTAAAAAGAALVSKPADLATWTKELPMPTLK